MSSQTINIITFEQKVEYTKRKILIVSKVNKNRLIRKKVQHVNTIKFNLLHCKEMNPFL